MAYQSHLPFDGWVEQMPNADEGTIQRAFEKFHAAHPEVYAALVRAAQKLLDQGRRRYGVRKLWEQFRWELPMKHSCREFKLNDHFHSRYVRMLIDEHPKFAGMFELRRLRAA